MTVKHHTLQNAAWIGMLLAWAGSASFALAQGLPDRPRDYVVDLAGVVDAGVEQQLNLFLKELEQKTTAQIVVLAVPTTNGIPIEEYAVTTFERWKLGRKGKDNGILFVVAVQDRRAKIETGYGMESVLPDAVCNRVAREIYAPHFKRGDYGRGILEGTLVLANRVAKSAGVTITGLPARSLSTSRRTGGWMRSIVPLFVLLIVVSSIFGRGRYMYGRSRHVGGWWPWLLLGMMGGGFHGRRSWGGGHGGGFGGGGFGSGGFGGGGSFGGGGGGFSGGGGSSFGW